MTLPSPTSAAATTKPSASKAASTKPRSKPSVECEGDRRAFRGGGEVTTDKASGGAYPRRLSRAQTAGARPAARQLACRRLGMKYLFVCCITAAVAYGVVRAEAPKPTSRSISTAESVLAVYVESLGFVPADYHPLLLAMWPDGTAVWSTDRLKGGAPYRTGKVEPKRVTEFLKRVESDGLFADKKSRWSHFGPDSRFTTILLKSGKDSITMQSWHELGEAGGGWAGTDGGLTMLDGKRRLDVIRKSSAEFLYFRFVWAETRGRLNDLMPAESQPTSGRPVMKAGEYYWEEAPAKK